MSVLLPLGLVVLLFLAGFLGAGAGLTGFLAVAVPCAALALFAAGMVRRIAQWVAAPVPFRIPTTSGQQASLPWIRRAPLDNPSGPAGVAGRMALEVLVFRSLLANTRTEMTADRRLVYRSALGLWLGAMAMHWALLAVLLRHLRFAGGFGGAAAAAVESLDGFLEIGLPGVFLSTLGLAGGLAWLLWRRLTLPEVRYISIFGDWFALFLLLGIAGSGAWLRHVEHADVAAVKEYAGGLLALAPVVPAGLSPLFLAHLLLACVLVGWFPFSKLLHAPGVFFSPTRNMANSNRAVRHVNPWDHPVVVHTYGEYEDELREKMIGAGLPVEKGP